MAEIIFNYESTYIAIQCNINDKMQNVINKYLTINNKNDNINDNNLYYIYNGEKVNKDLTFNEQANEIDKKRKKMDILVINNEDDINKKNEIISDEIICPKCKENSIIDINNFKFTFHGCINNHEIKDILIDKYEETQKIDLNKIMCDICKQNNKGNAYKNRFYKCYTCKKNICILCKSIHDTNHIIINYDDRNYFCRKHNDSFIKYCKACKKKYMYYMLK